jgi:hypothetical protein
MRTDTAGVVWGLGYATQWCLHRLAGWFCETRLLVSFGAGLHEARLLASFGGWDMRKQVVDCVWELSYAKRAYWCLLGDSSCEIKVFASLGSWVT